VNPRKLVLFDIDGTILTTVRKAWLFPFGDAIEAVLGVKLDPAEFKAGGKTDPQIVLEMTGPHGISKELALQSLSRIKEIYLQRLKLAVQKPEDALLKPGIPEILAALAKHPEVALGLLTGNFEEGARIKLEVHGLNGFFSFGVYGDGAVKRTELAHRIAPLAREKFGRVFEGKDVVLVGDTPFDVDCAREIGARVVAVATGPYTLEQLKPKAADQLFENLSDTERVLSAILE